MDRLERVARAIAQARGLDPDAESGGGEWLSTPGPDGAVTLERQPHPAWRLCESDAREHIAAHLAMLSQDGDQAGR